MTERHGSGLRRRLDRGRSAQIEPPRAVPGRLAVPTSAPRSAGRRGRAAPGQGAPLPATSAAAALEPLTVPNAGSPSAPRRARRSGARRPGPRPPASGRRRRQARSRRRRPGAPRRVLALRGAPIEIVARLALTQRRSASSAASAGMLTIGTPIRPCGQSEPGRQPGAVEDDGGGAGAERRPAAAASGASPAGASAAFPATRLKPRRSKKSAIETGGGHLRATEARRPGGSGGVSAGESTGPRAPRDGTRRRRPSKARAQQTRTLRVPPVVGRTDRQSRRSPARSGDAAVSWAGGPVVPAGTTTSVSRASAPATARAPGLSGKAANGSASPRIATRAASRAFAVAVRVDGTLEAGDQLVGP